MFKAFDRRRPLIIDIFLLLVVVIVLLFLFLLNSIFFMEIKGKSMEPTYKEMGDWVIITNAYLELKRGDIVVFQATETDKYIKRIIATGGDSIKLVDNGQFIEVHLKTKGSDSFAVLDEAFIKDNIDRDHMGLMQNGVAKDIPKDTFFVMGDNRNNSTDSRVLGVIYEDKITGAVVSDSITKVEAEKLQDMTQAGKVLAILVFFVGVYLLITCQDSYKLKLLKRHYD